MKKISWPVLMSDKKIEIEIESSSKCDPGAPGIQLLQKNLCRVYTNSKGGHFTSLHPSFFLLMLHILNIWLKAR